MTSNRTLMARLRSANIMFADPANINANGQKDTGHYTFIDAAIISRVIDHVSYGTFFRYTKSLNS